LLSGFSRAPEFIITRAVPKGISDNIDLLPVRIDVPERIVPDVDISIPILRLTKVLGEIFFLFGINYCVVEIR